MGSLSNLYIEGPRIGIRLKVGRWAYFQSGSKWRVGTGDGLTFEYGLTIKDLQYTHSGASRHFWKGVQLIWNSFEGRSRVRPAPTAQFNGGLGCNPWKFFKIGMWNGAFFLHSECICTTPKFFERLDVKLHFLEIGPPGANALKRDAEFMNLA